MAILSSAALLVVVTVAAAAADVPDPLAGTDVEAQFQEYLQRFGKRYEGAEWHARLAAFRESLQHIQRHDAKKRLHRLRLNELADVPADEIARTKLGLRAGGSLSASLGGAAVLGVHRAGDAAGALGSGALPSAVDWRVRGAVNPSREQGGCGACWTFASSGALAGAWQIASGRLANVSEQQLLDCAGPEFGDNGCTGGAFDGTYRYAEGVALCTAESYLYEHAEGVCRDHSAACDVAVPSGAVQGVVDVQPRSEEALLDAVAQQPVTVGIYVNTTSGLSLYSGGIFSDEDCDTTPNHAVLVVGYGTEDGQDYWLIQNSWGPNWGEGGFFRMARGPGPDGAGECAILSMPAYPVVRVPTESEATTSSEAAGQGEETTELPFLETTEEEAERSPMLI